MILALGGTLGIKVLGKPPQCEVSTGDAPGARLGRAGALRR
jgi:hypothetical protein